MQGEVRGPNLWKNVKVEASPHFAALGPRKKMLHCFS